MAWVELIFVRNCSCKSQVKRLSTIQHALRGEGELKNGRLAGNGHRSYIPLIDCVTVKSHNRLHGVLECFSHLAAPIN